MIKQAYVDYAVSNKLSFTAGLFGTHIGYELIDAPLNFHYSINNSFNAGIPFYHLGLKANYAFSDNVSVMGGIVNGTDNINDNNRGKSFIGQIAVEPTEGLNISFNTIQGNEGNAKQSGKDTVGYFGVLDLVVSYQLTRKFSMGLWLMKGTVKGDFQGGGVLKKKHWHGTTIYAQYDINDYFSLGARVEYFDNISGARGLLTNGQGTEAWNYTLTGNITLSEGRILLKPEWRLDKFKEITSSGGEIPIQQFEASDGTFSKNTQSTLGLALIYVF